MEDMVRGRTMLVKEMKEITINCNIFKEEVICPYCQDVFNPNKEEYFECDLYLLMFCSQDCLREHETSQGI